MHFESKLGGSSSAQDHFTRLRERLVLSQVRFKRVPGKIPEKVRRRSGGFGAKSGQVQ